MYSLFFMISFNLFIFVSNVDPFVKNISNSTFFKNTLRDFSNNYLLKSKYYLKKFYFSNELALITSKNVDI